MVTRAPSVNTCSESSPRGLFEALLEQQEPQVHAEDSNMRVPQPNKASQAPAQHTKGLARMLTKLKHVCLTRAV